MQNTSGHMKTRPVHYDSSKLFHCFSGVKTVFTPDFFLISVISDYYVAVYSKELLTFEKCAPLNGPLQERPLQ